MAYQTAFYDEGDPDKKGPYPGHEAAEWYCLEQLRKDNKGAEFQRLEFQIVPGEVSGRGKRVYCKLKAMRVK